MKKLDERLPSEATWNDMQTMGHMRFVIGRSVRTWANGVAHAIAVVAPWLALMFFADFFMATAFAQDVVRFTRAEWPVLAGIGVATLFLALGCAEWTWRLGCASHGSTTSGDRTYGNA